MVNWHLVQTIGNYMDIFLHAAFPFNALHFNSKHSFSTIKHAQALATCYVQMTEMSKLLLTPFFSPIYKDTWIDTLEVLEAL